MVTLDNRASPPTLPKIKVINTLPIVVIIVSEYRNAPENVHFFPALPLPVSARPPFITRLCWYANSSFLILQDDAAGDLRLWLAAEHPVWVVVQGWD